MAAPARRFSSMRATTRRRARGPSPALKKAQAALVKTRASLRVARTNAKSSKTPLMSAVCTTGGGASAGVVQAFVPAIGPVDTRLLAGALFVGGGATVLKNPTYQAAAICIGSGMLAAWASDFTYGMFAGSTDAE